MNSPKIVSADCTTREILHRISDKWTVPIGVLLADRPHRFGELLKGIEGISKKMLAQTLRSLERDGLVTRSAYPTVPVTVEYALTPLGETMVGPIGILTEWAENHVKAITAARSVYDSRTSES